jgi:hypothetical protein
MTSNVNIVFTFLVKFVPLRKERLEWSMEHKNDLSNTDQPLSSILLSGKCRGAW